MTALIDYLSGLLEFQVKKNPSLDALVSDICIATSAAPTYLPAHYFSTKNPNGSAREFNLIDGGVAANNPVGSSVSENFCAIRHSILSGNMRTIYVEDSISYKLIKAEPSEHS